MPDFLLLSHFHFLRPAWFLMLLPFAGLSLLQWQQRDIHRQWRSAIAAHLLPRMIVPGSQRRLFSPLWVSTILSPMLIVALAGPSWTRGESPFAEDASALVIAVDLSDSMNGRDVMPNRLQRARSKILALAETRGAAYTGLLAYAGSGHTVIPLTNDSSLLLHYLDALEVGMLPRRGKAPEVIIDSALDLLRQRNGGSLLIVGDGASKRSADAFEALGDQRNVQLLVWGIGKTQAEMDADAARGLISNALPLQEVQLQAIARAGGGYYRRLSSDDSDLRDILRRIDRHFRTSEDSARPWIDGGYYLVLPIMLLFLLWFRVGWVLRW